MNIRNLSSVATIVLAATLSLDASAYAQGDRNVIMVNSDVTTHIVMPENLKLVDISTANIIGNQCADNMVRIKPTPVDSIGRFSYRDNEFLGTVTLIGERHMAQYDIRYETVPQRASSIYNVSYDQTMTYSNPEVSMPESEISRFAWAVYGSKRKFNNIKSNAYGIKASIYNIYTIGNYFFIDFCLENKSNVEYDIDEIKVTLTDKKETKATNSQTIQINPVYTLNPASKFKKNYRQVLVLDKLTYPEEKIINITVTENQISGRQVVLSMEYADVLNADGFDITKIDKIKEVRYIPVEKGKAVVRERVVRSNDGDAYKEKCANLEKENTRLNDELKSAKGEVKKLTGNVSDLEVALAKMEAAYRGANDTIEKILSKERKGK